MKTTFRRLGAAARALALMAGFIAAGQTAHAACAGPNGNAGDVIYASNYNTMAFCNGSTWTSMAGGVSVTVNTSGGGATPAGSSADVQFNSAGALAADTGNFTYSSGLLSAPNISATAMSASGAGTFGTINSSGLGTLGSLLVAGGATITGQASITTISSSLIQVGNNGASCTSGLAGGVRYNSTSNTIDYCSGSAWLSLGPSATQVPAFSVNKSGTNQTVSAGVSTLLTWSNELFDTNNNFDTGTNRFTPTIPGKYLITLNVGFTSSVAGDYVSAMIRRNGSTIKQTTIAATGATQSLQTHVTAIVDMNGSTDYIEGYAGTDLTTIKGTVGATGMDGILISMAGGGTGGTAAPAGSTNDVQFNSGGVLAADTGNFTYGASTLAAPIVSASTANITTLNSNAVNNTGLGTFGSILDNGGLTVLGAASMTTISSTAVSSTLIQVGNGNGVNCAAGLNGAIRYNSTSNTIQVCAGTTWASLSSGTTAGGGSPAGSTGDIQFNTSGAFDADTGKLYWDKTNDRLGVGTASPVQTLDVAGTLRVRYPSATQLQVDTTATGQQAAIGFYSNGSGKWQIGKNIGDQFFLWDSVAVRSAMNVYSNGNMSLMPDSGNVGIGTYSPAATFDVSGTTGQNARFASSGGVSDVNYLTVGQRTMLGYDGTTGNAVLQGIGAKGIELNVNNGTFGSGTAVIINTAGNVGVGTMSPASTVDISGTLRAFDYVNSAGYVNPLSIAVGNNSGGTNYSRIALGQVSTNNMFIEAADQGNTKGALMLQPYGGYVTVNSTTSPTYVLTVGGDVYLTAGWLRTTGATGWYNQTYGGGWYMTDSTYIRNYASKEVLLSANITAPAFLYSSDKRLKSDITTLTGGLAKLDTLNPVSFRFTSDPSKTIHLGLIAQDVRKVYPEAVHADDKGFLKLDYPSLIGPMIGMMKELKSIVFANRGDLVEAKAEIRQLKADNDNLEAANRTLKAANDNAMRRLDALEHKQRAHGW